MTLLEASSLALPESAICLALLVLAGAAGASVAFRRPWTAPFAALLYRDVAETPLFLTINRAISALWAVLLLWLAAQPVRPGPWILGLGTWLVSAVLALTWWRGTGSGAFAWGGSDGWWITAGGRAREHCLSPRVCLDLQSSLLLRVERQGGASEWLWLEQGLLPQRWPSLRRALAADRAARGRA